MVLHKKGMYNLRGIDGLLLLKTGAGIVIPFNLDSVPEGGEESGSTWNSLRHGQGTMGHWLCALAKVRTNSCNTMAINFDMFQFVF